MILGKAADIDGHLVRKESERMRRAISGIDGRLRYLRLKALPAQVRRTLVPTDAQARPSVGFGAPSDLVPHRGHRPCPEGRGFSRRGTPKRARRGREGCRVPRLHPGVGAVRPSVADALRPHVLPVLPAPLARQARWGLVPVPRLPKAASGRGRARCECPPVRLWQRCREGPWCLPFTPPGAAAD